MPLSGRLVQITEIGGDTGHAQHTGALVQARHYIGHGAIILIGNKLHHACVHVPGPRAHGQARQRRQSHRGIHAAATINGGQRCAVSQMAGHNFQILYIPAQQRRCAHGYIPVRGAMEAIAAELVVFVIFIGNAVQEGMLRHGLVKCRVKHSHLRHIRPQRTAACLDANNISGVMQRGQRIALLHRLEHLVGNQHGFGKFLTAVHHPMPHGVNLAHGSNHAVLRVGQRRQHRLDGLGMSGHGNFRRFHSGFSFHLRLIGKSAVNADALAKALGVNKAALRIHQLIFQRGAARIDNQYFHLYSPSTYLSYG